MRQAGIESPRIAVAALNPHNGENGLFGMEEIEIIRPVVEEMAAKGINCKGPFASDTVYIKAFAGEYDSVLSMYHDQGLAPVKMIAFDTGVNLTLGLPFVRTSPDHGTAYDIAGKNVARPESMIAAIQLAAQLAAA